jgi:hypothetical protein
VLPLFQSVRISVATAAPLPAAMVSSSPSCKSSCYVCRRQLYDRYCVIGFFVFGNDFDAARQIALDLQLKKVFDAPIVTTITLVL